MRQSRLIKFRGSATKVLKKLSSVLIGVSMSSFLLGALFVDLDGTMIMPTAAQRVHVCEDTGYAKLILHRFHALLSPAEQKCVREESAALGRLCTSAIAFISVIVPDVTREHMGVEGHLGPDNCMPDGGDDFKYRWLEEKKLHRKTVLPLCSVPVALQMSAMQWLQAPPNTASIPEEGDNVFISLISPECRRPIHYDIQSQFLITWMVNFLQEGASKEYQEHLMRTPLLRTRETTSKKESKGSSPKEEKEGMNSRRITVSSSTAENTAAETNLAFLRRAITTKTQFWKQTDGVFSAEDVKGIETIRNFIDTTDFIDCRNRFSRFMLQERVGRETQDRADMHTTKTRTVTINPPKSQKYVSYPSIHNTKYNMSKLVELGYNDSTLIELRNRELSVEPHHFDFLKDTFVRTYEYVWDQMKNLWFARAFSENSKIHFFKFPPVYCRTSVKLPWKHEPASSSAVSESPAPSVSKDREQRVEDVAIALQEPKLVPEQLKLNPGFEIGRATESLWSVGGRKHRSGVLCNLVHMIIAQDLSLEVFKLAEVGVFDGRDLTVQLLEHCDLGYTPSGKKRQWQYHAIDLWNNTQVEFVNMVSLRKAAQEHQERQKEIASREQQEHQEILRQLSSKELSATELAGSLLNRCSSDHWNVCEGPSESSGGEDSTAKTLDENSVDSSDPTYDNGPVYREVIDGIRALGYEEKIVHYGDESTDYKYIENPVKAHETGVFIHKTYSVTAVHNIQQLDLVFLDGDHTFVNVVNEVALYHRKITKHGVLSGHDFGADTRGEGVAFALVYIRNMGSKSWMSNRDIYIDSDWVWWMYLR